MCFTEYIERRCNRVSRAILTLGNQDTLTIWPESAICPVKILCDHAGS
jgi:hypothetical protein